MSYCVKILAVQLWIISCTSLSYAQSSATQGSPSLFLAVNSPTAVMSDMNNTATVNEAVLPSSTTSSLQNFFSVLETLELNSIMLSPSLALSSSSSAIKITPVLLSDYSSSSSLPSPGSTAILEHSSITTAITSSVTTNAETLIRDVSVTSTVPSPTMALENTTTSTENTTVSTTEEGSTSVLDYLMENTVAFSLVGGSAAFLLSTCCCLCCVVICRKRLIRWRQQRRNRKILSDAGDVWIVNKNATLRSNSPEPEQTRHNAAATSLQMNPDQSALIMSNPNVPQPSVHQYHEMPDLTSSPPLPTLSPMTSAIGLVSSPTYNTSSTSQLIPSPARQPQNTHHHIPSAPPMHHIN